MSIVNLLGRITSRAAAPASRAMVNVLGRITPRAAAPASRATVKKAAAPASRATVKKAATTTTAKRKTTAAAAPKKATPQQSGGLPHNPDAVGTIPTATKSMEKAGVDFAWSKEGREQGHLERLIKEQEAKRTALQQKAEIDYGGIRREQTLAQAQTFQNQNKMGITGDAAKDMERSVQVAKNARALNLFSIEEMIKYGYDTGVKIAEMFGDLKAREVTIEEYQRAWTRAHEQAAITGTFFDPIQLQLLAQNNFAEATLRNPYASASEKKRAKEVSGAISNSFLELGISRKGVQTITSAYQQESLRIQAAANAIAARGNQINAMLVNQGIKQSQEEQILKWFDNNASSYTLNPANPVRALAEANKALTAIKKTFAGTQLMISDQGILRMYQEWSRGRK